MPLPRGQLAGVVDRRLERVETARSVVIEGHVVFAHPLHFDGDAAGLLRDGRGLAHRVVREPPAEAAATTQLVQRDLVLRQPEQRSHGIDGRLRRLRRRPDLDAVALEPGRRVLRLEVRVRYVVVRVHGLERLARRERDVDVTGLAEHLRRRWFRRESLGLCPEIGPAVAGGVRLVPRNLQLFLGLHRRPRRARENRDARSQSRGTRVEAHVIALLTHDERVLHAT